MKISRQNTSVICERIRNDFIEWKINRELEEN